MPDLDTRLRKALEESIRWDTELGAVGILINALLAALDWHKPYEDGVCSCLPDSDNPNVAHKYPCPTVLAIAKELGVEVSDV